MFKKRFFLLSLSVISAMSSASTAQAGGLDFLTPVNLEKRVRHEIAKAEIGANLKIFSAEVFDGLGIALRYRIESEPSYVNGFYTRIDKYSFNANVNAGELIDDLDTPIAFNIDKGAELIFARQFKSQRDSLVALPYTVRNIPLTAERAIRHLNVGDFVGMEANLAFVLSLSGTTLQGGFDISGSTHAFISGKFLVHLFRLPDNKMRVKLISLNRKGTGIGGGVKYGLDLDFFGFSFIEKKIDKLVDLKPLAFGVSTSKNNVFMLDYVVDLDDPIASQAYDDMMLKKVRFQELKSANPLLTQEKMEQMVLNDLSAIEDLAMEDRTQHPQNRRVHRIFKGISQSINTDQNFKIGFNVLKFENGSSWATSKVTSYDKHDVPQKFILETHTEMIKKKAIFGIFNADTRNSSSLLFLANEKYEPTQFIAMSLDQSKKESDMTRGDLKEIQDKVRALIPSTEFNKIPWYLYDFKNGEYINSAYRIQIFFKPDALKALPQMSEKALKERFKQYVKMTGGLNVAVANVDPSNDKNNYGPFKYDYDFQEIARLLKKVTDPSIPAKERLYAFNGLKRIPAWQKKGEGFLLSLMPISYMNQLIAFEFSLQSSNGPSISHKYGNFEQEALYDALLYTQSVINNHGFDLRLWTDGTGEYTIKSNQSPLQ